MKLLWHVSVANAKPVKSADVTPICNFALPTYTGSVHLVYSVRVSLYT